MVVNLFSIYEEKKAMSSILCFLQIAIDFG